jgi:hypothetical protein
MSKKEIPNVLKNSEISRDYILALGSVINFIESIENDEPSRTRHLAKRSFLHREVPYYEAYFSSENFNNIINDENKESISEINSIVDTINSCRLEGIVEYEAIQPLVLRIINLINQG